VQFSQFFPSWSKQTLHFPKLLTSKYSKNAASKLDGIRKQMHATVLHTPKCLQQTHAPVRKLDACQPSNFTHTHYTVSAIGEAQ
jgi:hypothetical protein